MKKLLSAFAFVSLMAGSAFAHAGHAHTYMGTVTNLHSNSFIVKTTAGTSVTVETTKATTYLHADNHRATRSELVVGSRVVVKMLLDGKTARSVKMSAPTKK